MHHFAAPLNTSQQSPHALRATQYRKPRRRRPRDAVEDASSPEPEPDAHSRAHSYASHASAEIDQLRVAGLLPEDDHDVPALPFPHAPASASPRRYSARKIQEDIAKPPARLYVVPAQSRDGLGNQTGATSLRKTHLHVLSTLVHRCLLDGDYERAGRAWGMLLRTHVAGGRLVDPRHHGHWGVGAEVLLRKAHQGTPSSDNASQPGRQPLAEQDLFSQEGFDLAREYYERLIVQFPHRKLTPHAVDERTFYPAMFSLWIFEVCEKSRRAKGRLQRAVPRPGSNSISPSSVVSDSLQASDDRAQADAIQVEELASAIEIAERLDQLIASPPFDKHASLLRLRGHVALWTSTLLLGRGTDDQDWDMDTISELEEDEPASTAEQPTKLVNCQRELQQAQQFLQKAEANGAAPQIATLSSIEVKLRELTRQLARLQPAGEN